MADNSTHFAWLIVPTYGSREDGAFLTQKLSPPFILHDILEGLQGEHYTALGLGLSASDWLLAHIDHGGIALGGNVSDGAVLTVE